MAAGYGATFTCTTLRGWHKDIVDGYLRQIKRLARTKRMRPGNGPRAVLECRMQAIAHNDQSESSAKALVLAPRLVETMG